MTESRVWDGEGKVLCNDGYHCRHQKLYAPGTCPVISVTSCAVVGLCCPGSL